MKEVSLYGKIAAGRVALIDDEDYDLVRRYRWNCYEIDRGPARRNYGPYVKATVRVPRDDPQFRRYADGRAVQRSVWMHTLITGYERTDHVNHDGLDNRRANLRAVTNAQNNHNQRPRAATSSQYKGVTWHKQLRKWWAAIRVDGRNRSLGCYATEEEAALAYDVAAREVYGEYAYLNLGAI